MAARREPVASCGNGRYPLLAERLWQKVDKSAGDEGCWPFTGALNQGYGWFIVDGKSMYAHRVAFFVTHGYWPEVGRHSCDFRRCCNPAHILDGTVADNNWDKVNRGRHNSPNGERASFAKLTEDQVREVRMRFSRGEMRSDLAREYGITHRAVSMICNRESWKHVA